MKFTRLSVITLLVLSIASLSLGAVGQPVSATGVNGYDLVSFQTGEKPLRGNGNHISRIGGVTYLFVNKENAKAFDANPARYLPAYGGYCAFGVSVGKKFVGDPDVWRLVDGKLHLNLDTNIQAMWLEDIDGKIKKANSQWAKIRNTPAAEL